MIQMASMKHYVFFLVLAIARSLQGAIVVMQYCTSSV